MFIIDYTNDYSERTENTQTFTADSSVIDFIANMSSESKHFKTKRINKYSEGVLYPYELKITSGRIVLESSPFSAKGEVK